jgi:hypothetical protein
VGVQCVAAAGNEQTERGQCRKCSWHLFLALRSDHALSCLSWVSHDMCNLASQNPLPAATTCVMLQVAYKDPVTGSEDKVQAGRMECTMQNIADFMTDRLDRPLLPGEAAGSDLSTFLVYNMRRKVRTAHVLVSDVQVAWYVAAGQPPQVTLALLLLPQLTAGM